MVRLDTSESSASLAALASFAARSFAGADEAIAALLTVARDELGLATALVVRAEADRWRATYVADQAFGLVAGDRVPLEDTLGRRVVGSVEPLLLNNAPRDPTDPTGTATARLGIGTFAGVPLVFRDGTTYGTLCALDPCPSALGPAAIDLLRVLARLVAHEIERERANSESCLLQDSAVAIARAADLDGGLGEVLRLVCDATGWVLGQAWLPSGEGAGLVCSRAWYAATQGLDAFRAASEGLVLEPGSGLPGRAWASSRPVWSQDMARDPGLPRAAVAAEVGLAGAVAVPVLVDGAPVAVLEFLVREPRDEDERLVGVVSAVAAEIGIFVHRKRIEAAVYDGEARLRAVVESASDAIVSQDDLGRIVAWNRAAERIFGYPAAAVLGQSGSLIVPDRYRDAHQAGVARLAAGGPAHVVGGPPVELQGLREDGSEFPVELTLSAWRAGERTFFTAIIRDISERKRVEAELDRERQFLAAVLENVEDGIVACDADGVLTVFNGATRRFHGLPSAPLPAELWAVSYDLYHADGTTLMEMVDVPLMRALRGDRISDVEMVIAPVDGPRRTLLASGRALAGADGEPLGAVISMHDITEQKRAEEAMIAATRAAE